MNRRPPGTYWASPPLYDTYTMLASSRPLSMTEFISRSTMDPDGNRFLQSVHRYPNIHRSLYTAWSLDVTHRHPTHYRTVPTKNQLFEDTKVGGRGALSLENLIRRQIVSRYLNDLSEDILEDVEWYRLAKKVWEDILRAGEDSFKVFSRFCTVYGHEPDFIAMLELSPSSSGMKPEAVGADGSMTLQLGKHFMSVKAFDQQIKQTNKFRYRVQLIKSPPPPWAYSIPLLTAPKPILNNDNFSWLVCLELTDEAFLMGTTTRITPPWSHHDLGHSLGELPNLAVLSIHAGRRHRGEGARIAQGEYLSQWARCARMGSKWGSLRILVLEERLDGILDLYKPHPRHHLNLTRNPPIPPLPPKRTFFEELDSFPLLSIVALHFPPPPAGYGIHSSFVTTDGTRVPFAHATYPLYSSHRTRELFNDADNHDWFQDRVNDFNGTLKDRPAIIKHLVKSAGVGGMRDLAKACSELVQLENREKEVLKKMNDSGVAIPPEHQGIWRKKPMCTCFRNLASCIRHPHGAAAPSGRRGKTITTNTAFNWCNDLAKDAQPPPIMVNVVFEPPKDVNESSVDDGTKHAFLSSYHDNRRVYLSDSESEERRLIFEKKRVVLLTPPSDTSSPAQDDTPPDPPLNLRKRKGECLDDIGSVYSENVGEVVIGDGAGQLHSLAVRMGGQQADLERERGGHDNKKMKSGMSKSMGDLLAEFMV